MAEQSMFVDDYTHYRYDEEADLERVPYWIFSAGHTAPGHPRTPMFDWMFMSTSNWGFKYAVDRLSIPTHNGIDFRSYHGYELITTTLPQSKEEIKRRSEKFREAIRPLIENSGKLWSDAKAELLGYTEKPKKFDFDKATWFQMAELFRDRCEAERKMYEIHHYFGEGLGSIYILFEDLCRDLLGIDESDPLFQKLLAGFDNDSYEVDRGLCRLSQRADELGLRDILLGNRPEDVISRMEETEAGMQWVKELRDFLYVHGWRMPLQMEYITPTWVEEPSSAIVHIQQYLEKGGTFDLDEIRERQARERKKAEDEVTGRVPLEQRDWFRALMKVGQQFGVWNEEHAYYCEMYQHSMTRYVLLEIGKRIAAVGCIEKAEDTLFLVPEEIYKALSDPEIYSLKPTVRRRRAAWEENKKIIPPPLLGNVSPEEAGRMLVQSKDPMIVKVAVGRAAGAVLDKKADLVGQCGSPGVVEGSARVIFSVEQLGEVQKGEILVAPTTYTTWTPVFALIKGAVIDRGGALAHAAIVGREYGIPVVINVIEGSSKIKTGQRLKVDGNAGTVHILDYLDGKKILIVDDEPDVLDTLEALLPRCEVTKAVTFKEAEDLLKSRHFDMAILDIMGVDGYGLLGLAKAKKVVPVMLTAHALSVEDTIKSFEKGAASYVPKEKMANIEVYLNDILEGREKGENFWWRWLERFGSYYDKKFGPDWHKKDEDFLKKLAELKTVR